MNCPRGCPILPYVITDYGAGTGDYCPTCGASLSGRTPGSAVPLFAALAFVVALIVALLCEVAS